MSQQDLAKVREMVLQAVLNKETLPGNNEPLMFPDLPLLFSQPEIYLVAKDINEPGFVKNLSKPIRMVTEEFLKQEARKTGQVYFLQVNAEEMEKERVLITVELKVIASPDAEGYVLTSMQLNMQRGEAGWRVVGDVSSMSA